MARILFCTPQLPYPPHQGAAIRNLNLIKLAAEHHQVALCSFAGSSTEDCHIKMLQKWVSNIKTAPVPSRTLRDRVIRILLSRAPDIRWRLSSPQFRQIIESADLVQIEGLEMAQYGDYVSAPSVLDCHNAEWLLQKRTCQVDLGAKKYPTAAYSAVQWLQLRRYERRMCQMASAVLAVSNADRKALLNLDGNLPVSVIPNGVDCRVMRPAAEPCQAPTVLFTGTLDFRPNVDAVMWFVKSIWPRVKAAVTDATLLLAGREPVRTIADLHGSHSINVVANPRDILPYFRNAAVYVVPVRSGGGSRYKLLQAMATGLGIVSTRMGTEGVEVEENEHLLVADEPRYFAEEVVRLLRDPGLRGRLGAAARDHVAKRYDWPLLGPRLWEVYDRVLA